MAAKLVTAMINWNCNTSRPRFQSHIDGGPTMGHLHLTAHLFKVPEPICMILHIYTVDAVLS